MEPTAFTKLGGNPRLVDTRDHLIGSAVAPVYTFASTHPRSIQLPYYFQGQRPACGAHAGTSYKVLLNRKDGTNTNENDTPRYLWINMKRDGSSPSDGVTITAIFKAIQTYGADAFEPLENNVNLTDAEYAQNVLTAAEIQAGAANTISSYAFLTDISFNGIKQAINDFGAVLLLVNANAQMWTAQNGMTSWLEKDVLPLRPPTAQYPVIDGHFLLADSYDEAYIYGVNSFSTSWGRGGDFYFGADYASQILEGGVMHNAPKPVSQETVNAVQSTITAIPNVITAIHSLPENQQSVFKVELNTILNSLKKMLGG